MKLKDYNIILFDLDGTLTDPKIGITKSVQYALSKYNINVDNLDKLECFIGPPLTDSFKEFYSFDDGNAIKAIDYFREYFVEKGMYENEVYPGIHDLLDELRVNGKKLVVATSKPTKFAKIILEHFDLAKYFSLIVGSNLDGTRVAKSEIIEYIFSKLGDIDCKKVIMIGDRKHDVIGAKHHKIDSIVVRYGYGIDEEFIEASPTYFANSVKDISNILLPNK